MSGLIHPVGPEHGRTYWVRRAVVLGVLVLVVTAIISALVQLTAGAAEPEPEPGVPAPVADTPSPTPSASPTTSASPTPTPTPGTNTRAQERAEAEADAEPQATPYPAPEGQTPPAAPEQEQPRAQAPQCTPEQLQVAVDGPEEIAAGTDTQTFGVVVTNTTEAACTVPVSAENLTVAISAGDEQLWSTSDCPVVLPARTAYLAPGAWLSSDVTWGLSRSAPECGTAPGEIAAGDHVVTAELTDVPAGEREFRVTP